MIKSTVFINCIVFTKLQPEGLVVKTVSTRVGGLGLILSAGRKK